MRNAAFVFAFGLTLYVPCAIAQEPGKPNQFEYAAKVVCGVQKDPKDMRLARGFYATTINIHNPNDTDVKFFKKLALSFPPVAQRPGKVLPIAEDKLGSDEALKVDCNDIKKRLFPNGFPTPYIEGFVVIQSAASLDVTAVYSTASLDKEGLVTTHSSIDVEQIRERQRRNGSDLPDLIPVPDANGSFCKRSPAGLVVTVKNQGLALAGASTTAVDFSPFGTVVQPTPPLLPGASVDLTFNIPLGCFNPDCAFRITVDSPPPQVNESNEGNNVASGICIG